MDTTELARYLIGKTIVHDLAHARLSGRIVETEAYPVGDAAGHAYRGETPAKRSLFLERGHAYVYFAYGSAWMLNISGESAGIGAGVLLRAIEPFEGIALMRTSRGVRALRDLTRGPGRLAQAMRVDKRLDGIDLCGSRSVLWLGSPAQRVGEIGVTTRIGLSREAHRHLRFFERGNPFVSGPLHLLRRSVPAEAADAR
ncbi:MAG TPA: DNA-3-methyladenine glycosylase [Candidatus Acidoferrum sp.]|nr:DNA-3-methyladenine glycosylase [Candidatus Acidoferrum sp.]